ncbi:hypothetical protein B0H19DRAFT_1196995 [Mycena capillaripes]|nr:hypothetical protein B0H19DRAFT_1196995 [Mycena capillaripes]
MSDRLIWSRHAVRGTLLSHTFQLEDNTARRPFHNSPPAGTLAHLRHPARPSPTFARPVWRAYSTQPQPASLPRRPNPALTRCAYWERRTRGPRLMAGLALMFGTVAGVGWIMNEY